MNKSEQISCLQDKISRLQNREVKYVWELRLSQDDFIQLEEAIKQSITSANSQKHLFTQENALYTIVYVAEWYKRRYNGMDTDKDTCVVKLDDTCKQLWENSIYDSNTYVYDASSNPDKPSRQWVRSLYLMGGLALQQELKRANEDDNHFLVELCRLYHGESTDIMSIDDRTRSIPFQRSITERHSLFHYIASILKGDYPFAKEELKDADSLANQFIKRIQEANVKAKSEKFDFEWVIIYNGLHASASRNLKVKLRPEEIGGKLANYISFERAKRYWDIPNIEDVGKLSFDLSFIDKGRVVQQPNFKQPFMTFEYSDEGFEYAGDIDRIYYQNVPIGDFTDIQVWVKYGAEIKAIGNPQHFPGYIQIYKSPKDTRTWTSHRIAGAESAVLLSSRCCIKNQEDGHQCENLSYVNKDKQSEPVSWCPVYATVTVVNGDGKEVQLRNAVGKYQLLVKRYPDTIRYINSVQVDHFYLINGKSQDRDRIPVLFGLDGLELRFYSKEDAEAELVPMSECTIEWSQTNSRYVSAQQQVPKIGKCTFRVTWDKKAQTQSIKVFYVPFAKNGNVYPLWRDLEGQCIRCYVEGGDDRSIPYEKDYQPVDDVIEYKLGNDDDYVMLQIYRPIAISELYKGKKLIEYIDDDVSLPLLSANEYSIRRFDKDGVHRLIPTVEDVEEELLEGFASRTPLNAALYTRSLRSESINYYITKEETEGAPAWYSWDYCSEPKSVQDPNAWQGDGIVFESYKDVTSIRECTRPVYKQTSFFATYPPKGILSDVDCFDIISKHRTYYILFRPMQQLAARKQFVKELFVPLVQKRGGALTDSDKTNLYRFAREFLFDWLLLPRDEWQQAIDELPNSDQVQMKACVEELFRSHPLVKKDYDKKCMGDFIDKYWTFNHYYTDNKAIALALDLILGNTLTRGHNPQSVIREFHESPARFAELCRINIQQD